MYKYTVSTCVYMWEYINYIHNLVPQSQKPQSSLFCHHHMNYLPILSKAKCKAHVWYKWHYLYHFILSPGLSWLYHFILSPGLSWFTVNLDF